MAELTLLVNSTDTALLNSGAVSPAVASDAAVGAPASGGFASVLGNALTPAEKVIATESPPQMPGTAPPAVAESGDGQPLAGNALPSAALQNAAQELQNKNLPANDPMLEASLLSAVAQGMPASNGLSGQALTAGTMASAQAPELMAREGGTQPVLPSLTPPRQTIENGMPAQAVKNADMPAVLLNTQTNTQATTSTLQHTASTIPNTTQDMQRSASSPAIPVMLGKPISTAAQQALARASLNMGKSHVLREGSMPSGMSAALNAQGGLSAANYSSASTVRMDMFTAAMNAATQKEAQAELRLPVNPATAAISSPLAATGEVADGSINTTAALSRLPGTATNPVMHTLSLSTPVGQSSWASELGQRVTWLANSELREAQLQLHPRSLGAVEVRIAYGHEQQLNISFSAANPVARDALDASLPRLREMLEQQGLQLGDANISHEPPSEREQQQHVQNESFAHGEDAQLLNEPLNDVIAAESSTLQWVGEGMLDAYA